MEYNVIGNIGCVTIKWHPIYEYSLWMDGRCMSEHSNLIEAVGEICEAYSFAINNKEDND